MKTTIRTHHRKIILSTALAVIGYAAFRLSFGAQVTLFVAAGANPNDAWLYPIVVDVALAAGYLIRIWIPDLPTKLSYYLWFAIGLWTAISIAGNGYSVYALPADQILIPAGVAVVIHSIPSITLFLVIHLATTTVYRPNSQIQATREEQRSQKTETALERPALTVRTDIPPVSIDDLMLLADEGKSYQAIALEVGRSKSWVGDQIKAERDRRAEVA